MFQVRYYLLKPGWLFTEFGSWSRKSQGSQEYLYSSSISSGCRPISQSAV